MNNFPSKGPGILADFQHHPLYSPSGPQVTPSSSKTQFSPCVYHKKPIKYLCISPDCSCKHYTLCEDLECKNMHSHPNFNLISIEKFNNFKYLHLKSIQMLKRKISRYEKQTIESVVHSLTRDFEMARHHIESFYTHRAARKIAQGNYMATNSKELHDFVSKSILLEDGKQYSEGDSADLEQKKSFEFTKMKSGISAMNSKGAYTDRKESSGQFDDRYEHIFVQQSKYHLIETIENLQKSIKSLTATTQYKKLTLGESLSLYDASNSSKLQSGFKNSPSSPNSTIRKDTFQSKIIQFEEEYNSIVKMIRQSRIPQFTEFKLLYRGTQEEFSAKRFHQKTASDQKSTVLILVLAEGGRKFGAVLNAIKLQYKDEWLGDVTGLSFIFSLDHNQTYQIQKSANTRSKAIFCGSGSEMGPQIGMGCDFYISDKCHQNRLSGSNLGGSFQLPFGLEFGKKSAKHHLVGKENFSVIQYEVWRIL